MIKYIISTDLYSMYIFTNIYPHKNTEELIGYEINEEKAINFITKYSYTNNPTGYRNFLLLEGIAIASYRHKFRE